MIISIIVAIGENNAIGKNNQLLWYMPADLKYFTNQNVRAYHYYGPQNL